ncbi:MAG: DUF488 family protein [Dethiobacteria bacterium]
MVDTVYSIGYSGFSMSDFINTLQSNKISLVVDVRSHPYSQYFSDYNKESLEQTLKYKGIYYRNYAKEFGARQDERRYYSSEGYLDFELFAKSSPFLSGFDRLVKSMMQNYRFALMCAEKDPINCHRTILVTRSFHDAGYKVKHLLPNNGMVTQEDIENRLLDKYFPNRNQITLFGEVFSKSEYIAQAYRKRNSEIGYSIEEESE